MSHSHVCNHGNCLSGVLQLQTSRKPSAKESVYYNVAPILEVLENPQHISWAKDKKLKKKKVRLLQQYGKYPECTPVIQGID